MNTTDKPTTTASDDAKAMSDKSAQPENVRVFEIITGLIGAGFFAKCGSVYSGGWTTEQKAFNAVRAMLRKRNPEASFKQVPNLSLTLSNIREAQRSTNESTLKFP